MYFCLGVCRKTKQTKKIIIVKAIGKQYLLSLRLLVGLVFILPFLVFYILWGESSLPFYEQSGPLGKDCLG